MSSVHTVQYPSGQPPAYAPVNLAHQPTTIVITETVGGCPNCRVGVIGDNYFTCCGIFWSIVLFPIGLLCCFICKQRQCTNCHRTF